MSKERLEGKGFLITGRVQGVFFRVWTQRLAQELDLRGTVRNRMDGSVETHVEGSPDAVRDFESRLWEGPVGAWVDGIEVIEVSGRLPEAGCEIRPTV